MSRLPQRGCPQLPKGLRKAKENDTRKSLPSHSSFKLKGYLSLIEDEANE
jgi:hypothetical protein